MRPQEKHVKGVNDVLEPVWCRTGGAIYKHVVLSAKDAAKLDTPEGAVVVEISATLYAAMVEAAERLNAMAAKLDPLAARRGPR